MPTPEQLAYFRQNTVKDASVASWLVFSFSHPDFSEGVNLAALTNEQPIEFDDNFYTFEGVTYRPVSAQVSLPNESKDSNGVMSLTIPRAGSEVKKRMKEITPANSRVPVTAVFKQYQEGITAPVIEFRGVMASNFPKISGIDVKIDITIYNPNLLTNSERITTSIAPELRTS